MATVMDVQPTETRQARRPYFSAIRWGAIVGGIVSGSASYLLLALLGVAVGLTAVDPSATEPVGRVPLATGIWTGISMLVGAFIGGYVAGHMSGLSRSMDGMLHGFVSWGATTLLYAFLTTTALGALLGGTFRIINEGIQTGTQAAATAQQGQAGGGQNALDQLAAKITGGSGGQVSAESLSSVQKALAAGDRESAINIMVNEMGFERERAVQTVDKLGPMLSQDNVREKTSQATDVLTTTSWWLFIGLLLSLALGIAGGAAGVRASASRLIGDHAAERSTRY